MPEKTEKEKNRERNKGTTSIKIDSELWKEAKIEAIRQDMEVSALVERFLRRELSRIRGGANSRDV